MKTRRQPREERQSESSIQRLGLNIDPMAQLSGLVKLITESQAPGIQQAQFQDEMGFKRLMGEQQFEGNKAEWEQRALAEQNNQADRQRAYGLQEQQYDLQKQQYDQANLQKQNALTATIQDRQAGDKLDMFTKLLGSVNQQDIGAVDPAVAAQMLEQLYPGWGKLINPARMQQQGQPGVPPVDRTKVNPEIPNEAFDAAFAKHLPH